jgi:hypothetical protein
MSQAKKRVPHYSIGTAKQNILWDEEVKKGKTTPGPLNYRILSHNQTMPSRYPGRNAMGLGVKSN